MPLSTSNEADLVLLNGNIVTMSGENRPSEAIVVKNGVVQYLGNDKEALKYVGKGTLVYELEGRTVLPGFCDCHVHLISYGRSLGQLDLRGAKSISEIKELLKEFSSGNGSWIVGRGWHLSELAEGRPPRRWDLDEVVPRNPVVLISRCGHVGSLNTLAIAELELEKVFDNIGREHFEFDENGRFTGIVRERGLDYVLKKIPSPTLEEHVRAIKAAEAVALRYGIVAVEEAGVGEEGLRAYKKLDENGALQIKVNVLLDLEMLDKPSDLLRYRGKKVRVSGVKVFVDGSLGGRTAYLKEPYNDEPSTRGVAVLSQEELDRVVLRANKMGLRVCAHAIGDAALEMILESFEKSASSIGLERFRSLRNRVEHCQVLDLGLVQKMAKLGVIASIQPYFACSDFPWAIERLGKKRARLSYAWKTLVKSGLLVCAGSDAPVEDINPLKGIACALTRRNSKGEVWLPEERLSLEEALKMYTKNAAYAMLRENELGTIEVGKPANFVVLSHDISRVQPEDLEGVEVVLTVVDGKVVHSNLS